MISIIDDHDNVVYEKRHPNNLQAIREALESFRRELLACVVESTYNWYWLVDGLMDTGFDVRLAHTGAIPQHAGIKHSNDQSDARHLAHRLRLGILPEGHSNLVSNARYVICYDAGYFWFGKRHFTT